MFTNKPVFSLSRLAQSFRPAILIAAMIAVSLAVPAGWDVLITPSYADGVRPVDRVIAVVNDEVITEGELNGRLVMAVNQLKARNQPVGNDASLRREMMEVLILERAENQHAREIGIKVTDQQVEQAIDSIARDNKLTTSQMVERLSSEGIGIDAFRADIRNQIVRARLRETIIQPRISVSDADIDAYLLAQSGSDGLQPQYNVQQIFVRVPEQSGDDVVAEKKSQITALLSRAKAGEDFAALVADGSPVPGGQPGWRVMKDLPEIFATEVRKLQAGGLSDLIRSPAGFHILNLIEVRKGAGVPSGPPVVQSQVRHILIRPEDGVGEAEIVRRLEGIRDRIEAGNAKFEDMARQYSSDGSAGRGGNLGWVYPGDTVPAFERAMNALSPGEMSPPVRTQFGFHLIQLIERREDGASEERQRLIARQEIAKKRIADAFQEWRAELRDRTYVELRPE